MLSVMFMVSCEVSELQACAAMRREKRGLNSALDRRKGSACPDSSLVYLTLTTKKIITTYRKSVSRCPLGPCRTFPRSASCPCPAERRSVCAPPGDDSRAGEGCSNMHMQKRHYTYLSLSCQAFLMGMCIWLVSSREYHRVLMARCRKEV